MYRRCWAVLVTGMTLLGYAGIGEQAHAQGFMVEPMRVDLAASAGRTLEIPIIIRNTAASPVNAVTVRVVDIRQTREGSWQPVVLTDGEEHPANSLVPFITTSADQLDLEPLSPARLNLRVNVPPGRRGVHSAAILVESGSQPGQADGINLGIRVRFLIPVTIQMQGTPARTSIEIEDIVLQKLDDPGGSPSTRSAAIYTNLGDALVTVAGKVRVERRVGDVWRLVTEFDLRQRTMLPGSTFELGRDLERRLASGTYRLRAELTADGRRLPAKVKEIEFEGHTDADEALEDAQFEMSATMVSMDVPPGARRSTSLEVHNPSSETISVEVSVGVPPGLSGFQGQTFQGIELAASEWTQILPNKFNLRPGGTRTIRVTGDLPSDATRHPNYYASLELRGTYGEGQNAGEASSLVHLRNPSMDPAPEAIIDQLLVSDLSNGKYAVTARFLNIGNVHLDPSVRLELIAEGGSRIMSTMLEGNHGPLLPLGIRSFGTELELNNLDPGMYVLRVVGALGIGALNTSAQHVVEITEDDAGLAMLVSDVLAPEALGVGPLEEEG